MVRCMLVNIGELHLEAALTIEVNMNGNNEINWYQKVTEECRGYQIPNETIDNCLDVGCNVGGFVNAWKHRINKFYCVDASWYNIEQASQNLSDLGKERVFLMNYAVHNRSGDKLKLRPFVSKGKLSNSGSFGTTEFVYKDRPSVEGWIDVGIAEEVETISFQDLLSDSLAFFEEEEIDLMKIDIEGAEYDFLIGQDLTKIRYITMEFHNFLSKMDSDTEGINRGDALHQHILKTHSMVYSSGDGVHSHYNRFYRKN